MYNPVTGQDRTSVRVHNPPGGRSSITFGWYFIVVINFVNKISNGVKTGERAIT